MAGNGEFTISKERWDHMDEKDRSWIMYDSFIQHRVSCNNRFCKLERRKYWDKAIAIAAAAATALAVTFGAKQ